MESGVAKTARQRWSQTLYQQLHIEPQVWEPVQACMHEYSAMHVSNTSEYQFQVMRLQSVGPFYRQTTVH